VSIDLHVIELCTRVGSFAVEAFVRSVESFVRGVQACACVAI